MAQDFLGAQPAELRFKVTRPNGVPQVQIVSTSNGSRSTSTNAVMSPAGNSGAFRAEDVSIPFVSSSLSGVITANALSSHLRFKISGSNTLLEGTSACSTQRLSGICELAWDAP